MIKITNLHANVEGNEILKGINLEVNPGEIHAIMGPNGSGKSTLANVLAGHEAYEVTDGEILFEENDIVEMAPDERAREGLFLAFQYPIEIPGVSNSVFLKTAINEIRKHKGQEEISAKEFLALIRGKAEVLGMDSSLISRSVNQGFSGGEKKRNEILQLLTLNPKLAILDETDSGLDIDALKIVAHGVNKFKNKNNAVVLVTHYQRLLDYIIPDFVHVLYKGKIVKSGDKNLALELEERGYDWIIKEQPVAV
jgi:Fe-S cluster assembly ATP-binding protein